MDAFIDLVKLGVLGIGLYVVFLITFLGIRILRLPDGEYRRYRELCQFVKRVNRKLAANVELTSDEEKRLETEWQDGHLESPVQMYWDQEFKKAVFQYQVARSASPLARQMAH